MKAERRHELKSNSLIQSLKLFPETVKKYQSQIALVVILISLAIILLRYRMNAAEARLQAAQNDLWLASSNLQHLENAMERDPGNTMKLREDFYSEGLQQADNVLQKAPDSHANLKAQALLLKGDLNFNMANLPDVPGAATQPSLRPSESEESLLSGATDAYTEVLQNYASEKFAVTAAHFGLAAVAENQGKWDEAKAQYEAVANSDAETPYKNLANVRIALIPQLKQPVAVDLSAITPPATTQTTATAVTKPSAATRPAK